MPKKYTKKERIIYWTISLVVLFAAPILVLKILELGSAYRPIGIFLNGLFWFIIWGVIGLGIYETYKWIKLKRWTRKERKQVYEESLILDEIMEKDKKKKEQQDQQQQ